MLKETKEIENAPQIDESKKNRLIVAITSGAVLLFVVLISVMIWGICKSLAYKRDIEELDKAIAKYEVMIEENEETLEARSLRRWIEREALRLGYVNPLD